MERLYKIHGTSLRKLLGKKFPIGIIFAYLARMCSKSQEKERNPQKCPAILNMFQ